MKAILAALLLSSSAHAAVIGVIDTQKGRVDLHDEAGLCTHGAMKAEYIGQDGTRVLGCWAFVGGIVSIAFLDGDSARLQPGVVRKPVVL